MNRFVTNTTGGHPLKLDDFGFIQSAFSEALAGLLSGLATNANKGYILSGGTTYTDVNTNTLWLTEGYVVIKFGLLAEIFYVPNHDLGIQTFNAIPYWRLVETDVAPSPANYLLSGAKNVHKQRRLTLSDTATNFFPLYTETPNWIEHLASRMNGDTWHQVGQAGEPAYQNTWVVSPRPVKFRKQNGIVEIYGGTSNATFTSGNDELVFTLPANYRPLVKRVYDKWDRNANAIASIEVNTDGKVKVFFSTGAVSVNFDGIMFDTL